LKGEARKIYGDMEAMVENLPRVQITWAGKKGARNKRSET